MTEVDDAPVFGREDMVRLLLDELDGVTSGGFARGIRGEPGVGKSTVLATVAKHAADAGFTVLSAHGSESESHLPYASLHQLLRPVLARASGLPAQQAQSLLACFGMIDGVEANRFFTSLAVLDLLAELASEAPVVVCLDDLHWMDRPSVDALAFVARRIASERVVLLSTSRDPGFQLMGGEEVVSWVDLPGLSADAADELLRARAPELSAALHSRVIEQAAGNPLALVEFATALGAGGQAWTALEDELPMTLRLERAFAARADELGPVARAIVDVAALDDGSDFDEVLTAAAVVSGVAVDHVDARPAVELGLLTVTGSAYAFTHPLISSAVRQAMSRDRREKGHAALAAVLSLHPDRAVWHRASSMSGRDEPVAAELELAAGDARRRGAHPTALTWLERAAVLSPDPLDHAARLLSAAEVGYELGRFTEVEQIKDKVTRMTLRPRDRSRLTWLLGAFHDGATSDPSDVSHLVDLARDATADADVALAMQLLFGAARRVWWSDPGAVVRGEIVNATRAVPLPAADPRVLAVLGLAESLELSGPVIEQLDLSELDSAAGADIAALQGIAAFCAGDFVRAESSLSTAILGLRADGRLSLLAEALAIRAWAEINLGLFDASRSADEAMRLADETGQRVWAGSSQLAMAFIDAVGEGWDPRHPLLTQAEQTALQRPNASSSLLAAAQLVRGVAELGQDHPDRAYDELVRVFEPTDPAFQRVQQVWTISYLAEAAVRAGRRDDARAHLAAVEEMTHGFAAVGTEVALDYARAVLADDADAEPLFRRALAGPGRRFPWHQARTQLAYGAWLRRQRRVTESRTPLRAARTAFEAVGATPWALRADHELRATGERGWRPADRGQEQLSPQETQIAALAAQGLSNREIGQRLFLSHRTVGSHLYRIFPKLGVTSRQHLAGVLQQGQSSD